MKTEVRTWVFRTFTTQQAYKVGRFYFEKEFTDFNKMKTFSANHSAEYKKQFPGYCSTYFDKIEIQKLKKP